MYSIHEDSLIFQIAVRVSPAETRQLTRHVLLPSQYSRWSWICRDSEGSNAVFCGATGKVGAMTIVRGQQSANQTSSRALCAIIIWFIFYLGAMLSVLSLHRIIMHRFTRS